MQNEVDAEIVLDQWIFSDQCTIRYNEDVVENDFGVSFELFVSLIIVTLTFTKWYRDVIISNTTYNNDIIGI